MDVQYIMGAILRMKNRIMNNLTYHLHVHKFFFKIDVD